MSREVSKKRDAIVASLTELENLYPEKSDQLAEFKFYLEQDILGNNQAYFLRVNGKVITIAREEDQDTMLSKIEAFVEALNQKENSESPVLTETTAAEVTTGVSDTAEPLVPEKDKTYWRDLNVQIVLIKNAFADEPLGTAMAKLRQTIHQSTLGSEDLVITDGEATLDIKAGDNDETLKLKLSQFVKKIERQHEQKLAPFMATPREWVENSVDRKKIWSVIQAQLVRFKQVFKGDKLGQDVAELKDLIDGHQLGFHQSFERSYEWGTLEIPAGESLDNIVRKLIDFIQATQGAFPDKFKTQDLITATEVYEEREAEKTYWRDVLAGIDALQTQYPTDEYPGVQILKEMIENDELGHDNRVLLSVGPVTLNVSPKEKDKVIKRKISIFIGELKQIAATPENQEALDDVYWRDLLASLKSMEEAFGANTDYQMLMMSIEMGTFATVKNFKTVIDGVELKVDIKDTDAQLKQKLGDFITELKALAGAKINQQAFDQAQDRINQLERDALDIEARYQQEIASKDGRLSKAARDLNDRDQRIKQLEDELQQERASQQTTRYRSYSG